MTLPIVQVQDVTFWLMTFVKVTREKNGNSASTLMSIRDQPYYKPKICSLLLLLTCYRTIVDRLSSSSILTLVVFLHASLCFLLLHFSSFLLWLLWIAIIDKFLVETLFRQAAVMTKRKEEKRKLVSSSIIFISASCHLLCQLMVHFVISIREYFCSQCSSQT